MARPRNCRYVERKPHVTYFKPRGIPMTELTETLLTVEGLEALRLADLEGLTTGEGAERMRVSRHTFGRTLAAKPGEPWPMRSSTDGHCASKAGLTPSCRPTPRRTSLTRSFTCRKLPVSSEGPSLDDMVARASGGRAVSSS